MLALPLFAVSPVGATAGPLSADEIAGLQFMRAEEKLARGVPQPPNTPQGSGGLPGSSNPDGSGGGVGSQPGGGGNR